MMKVLKNTFLLFVIALTLFKCKSVPKLQKEAPTSLKEAYSQKWNAGYKDGVSGTDLYIQLHDKSIILDSVYFKEHVVKLKIASTDSLLFVGRIKSNTKITNNLKQTPFSTFQINDSECIISYKKEDNLSLQYYKISNIIMRQPINYPSSPSKI